MNCPDASSDLIGKKIRILKRYLDGGEFKVGNLYTVSSYNRETGSDMLHFKETDRHWICSKNSIYKYFEVIEDDL